MKKKLVKALPYVGLAAAAVTAYVVVTDFKTLFVAVLAAAITLGADRILRKNTSI